MSVFKKVMASAALAATMFASPAAAEDARIALVVKALGIGRARSK